MYGGCVLLDHGLLVTHISQKRSWSTSTVVVMSALSSSTVKQSTPGALPAFMLVMALLISALVMGPDGISSITSMSLITSASITAPGLVYSTIQQCALSIFVAPPLLLSTKCLRCSLPCRFSLATRCTAFL